MQFKNLLKTFPANEKVYVKQNYGWMHQRGSVPIQKHRLRRRKHMKIFRVESARWAKPWGHIGAAKAVNNVIVLPDTMKLVGKEKHGFASAPQGGKRSVFSIIQHS